MLCILSLFCDVAFRLFSSTIETLIKQSTSEIYVSCPYSILAPKTRFLSKPQWFKPHGPKTLSWSIYVSTEEVADDKRTILNGNTRHKRQKNFNERILLFFWRGEGRGDSRCEHLLQDGIQAVWNQYFLDVCSSCRSCASILSSLFLLLWDLEMLHQSIRKSGYPPLRQIQYRFTV